MGKTISGADREVLAEIVRLTQKQGLKGAEGGWKDFLQCHEKQFGSGLSDPAKRSKELLVAFLQTFRKDEKKVFDKMIRRNSDHNAMKQLIKDSPGLESAQQRLVRLTMEHPHYTQYYSLPFYDEDWIDIPLGKVSEAMKLNAMISVDCEMVLCQDGTDAVVKICAVDHNLEVKLEKLVNPGKVVVDYRTHITGISSKDLEGVTCSLVDIQESLKKLLSHGTILVGHSLHNDLRALKVNHPRVIDTSYIFKYAGLPTLLPSLNNLCKIESYQLWAYLGLLQPKTTLAGGAKDELVLIEALRDAVLGFPVRKEGEPHNCMNDAQAAMKLVLAKLENGYDDPIIPNSDLTKLLLHKIPIEVPTQELQMLFSREYNVIIESVTRLRGESYSTYAVFKNFIEADEAFNKIEGHQKKDSSGRPQKLVFMKLSSGKTTSFYVRRMTAEVHFSDANTSKRPVHDENDDPGQQQAGDGTIDVKRQKTCLYSCNHVKEMEKLKEELHEREEEIFNLQKTLFEVTRNQHSCNETMSS
ncbi:EXOIII [Musa troglodytarum]|uniref:EXOIII n=1 Tax=Musa troglodytarum TaxID=320322 RepID=A0A9E7GZH9_9LILI|nr:EXOIII [Musa troglodytarum]